MKGALFMVLLGVPGAAQAQPHGYSMGPIIACVSGQGCRAAGLLSLPPGSGEMTLERRVRVSPGALPFERPLMVRVIALASTEVRWNGTLIGSNGVPAATRAAEVPGRHVGTFIVPAALIREGENLVSVRLSSHRLIVPVRARVHAFYVDAYEGEALPGVDYYLPALLLAGALLLAATYFTTTALVDRADRRARLLAGAAVAGLAQLAIETSKAFVNYSYEWHLPRLIGVLLLAGALGLMFTAYAASRLAPPRPRLILGTTAGLMAAAAVLFASFDMKAFAIAIAGILGVLACALPGARRRRDARIGAAATGVALALALFHGFSFIDIGWYVVLAAVLIGLMVEQVLGHARLRREGIVEQARAAALEARLSRIDESAGETVTIKDGTRTHRLPEASILAVRAADDYCELRLVDGRVILATATLSRLLETLPDRFVRVHRSHAVNRVHVAMLTPRAVGLVDGSRVPVGRSYLAAVAALRGDRQN